MFCNIVVISCHAAKKSSFSPIFSPFTLVYPQDGDNFSPVWERKNTPRKTGGSTSKKHALTPQPNSHSGDSQTRALSPKAAQSSAACSAVRRQARPQIQQHEDSCNRERSVRKRIPCLSFHRYRHDSFPLCLHFFSLLIRRFLIPFCYLNFKKI